MGYGLGEDFFWDAGYFKWSNLYLNGEKSQSSSSMSSCGKYYLAVWLVQNYQINNLIGLIQNVCIWCFTRTKTHNKIYWWDNKKFDDTIFNQLNDEYHKSSNRSLSQNWVRIHRLINYLSFWLIDTFKNINFLVLFETMASYIHDLILC